MLPKAAHKIYFHFLTSTITLRERTALKKFIVGILKKEGKKLNLINYIFCNDAYLLKINQEYLNHNTLTDIITFEYSEKGAPVLSDIYISADRIKANAALFKTTIREELHRVIFHGVLHLCDYKDKKQSQQRVMRNKEDYYLALYFRSQLKQLP